MDGKVLGKIKSVNFGYREFMFGLHLELIGEWGGCDTSIAYNPSYKGMNDSYPAEMMKKIIEIMGKAKVSEINDLKNIPIEATFSGNSLKEFRILTEVL